MIEAAGVDTWFLKLPSGEWEEAWSPSAALLRVMQSFREQTSLRSLAICFVTVETLPPQVVRFWPPPEDVDLARPPKLKKKPRLDKWSSA